MAATRRKKQQRLELNGALWISVGDQNLGGQGRMALLQAVAELGSITARGEGLRAELPRGLAGDQHDEHAGG
jgi:molybdate transport system regulatory protein